jgi:hypothetical protein
MKRQKQKRSAYLEVPPIPLQRRRAIKVWGYDKKTDFVCRVEINAAGLEIYSGKKGGESLGNFSWKALVKTLKRKNG